MAATGETDDSIACSVGVSKKSVRHTIYKFTMMGMYAALNDLPRSGRPVVIDDEAKSWIKNLSCMKPKDLGYA
jgi:transposase